MPITIRIRMFTTLQCEFVDIDGRGSGLGARSISAFHHSTLEVRRSMLDVRHLLISPVRPIKL